MKENEKSGVSSYTPIKKSMKFQKQKNNQEIEDRERDNYKKYDVVLNGRELQILYDDSTGDVIIDNKRYPTKIEEDDGFYRAIVSDQHNYRIEFHQGQIFMEGRLVEFTFKPSVPKLQRVMSEMENELLIKAPLPGNIVGISVKIGDPVSVGTKILTLEAMKMQNEISSSINGRVQEIYIKKGQLVGTDEKLVLIVKN
ncbi:MAG: hypothetical protein OEZ01_00435 [Candidatus Heimdallarchaeota archaeon]|nr:hypothetical protein [Candidatus Heimdallarchaeota archaeon]MDH5644439.1 hypothetical protein [Candidatus Heimdallarchaeota archaeon]